MGMGISIFLIATGAVLTFALESMIWNGVNVGVIGIILMVVGGIGMIASMIAMTMRRTSDRHVVEHREPHPRH